MHCQRATEPAMADTELRLPINCLVFLREPHVSRIQARWTLRSATRMRVETTAPTVIRASARRLAVAGEISMLQQDHSQATGNVGDKYCDRPQPTMRDQAEIRKTDQHAVARASQPVPIRVNVGITRGKHRRHMGEEIDADIYAAHGLHSAEEVARHSHSAPDQRGDGRKCESRSTSATPVGQCRRDRRDARHSSFRCAPVRSRSRAK